MNTKAPSIAETVRLSMREIVGRGYAIENEGGQRVFERIAQAFRKGQRVELSFANVEITIAAFLNVAIGQLYGVFTEQDIRARLVVTDISQQDLALLKLVVDNAKQYFRRQREGKSVILEQLATLAASGTGT